MAQTAGFSVSLGKKIRQNSTKSPVLSSLTGKKPMADRRKDQQGVSWSFPRSSTQGGASNFNAKKA
jgi:hypothetical protein